MNHHKPIPPPKAILHRIDNDVDYNPKTGIFTWINPRNSEIKPGDIAGTFDKDGYVILNLNHNGKNYKIKGHHAAWYKYYGEWPPRQLDHRNTIKSANGIKNLRLATDRQSARNRNKKSTNTTGVTGVYIEKRSNLNPYYAKININGNVTYLGAFATLAEAKRARRRAEKKYYKRFRFRHAA